MHQRTRLRTSCVSWKRSDEVDSGCSSFWSHSPSMCSVLIPPTSTLLHIQSHNIIFIDELFLLSLPSLLPNRATTPWEQGWWCVLSINAPSHEMPSEQINLPFLGSGNAEILAHGNILYHLFANKEGEAQRHVVTDQGMKLERRRVGI